MKKYQIIEIAPKEQSTAGTKAPKDIIHIAKDMRYTPLVINWKVNSNILKKGLSQVSYYTQWKKIYKRIEKDSIVLIQYPSYLKQFSRLKYLKKLYNKKNVKFIFLVHDLNELRGDTGIKKGLLSFQDMKQLATKIIVHNDTMKQYFKKMGFSVDKLINLEIFDYLQSMKKEKVVFDKSITIAGNLDKVKSGYINKLDKISSKFILYGPNYTGSGSKNIEYKGVLAPDEVPKALQKGFGLIWDGNSLNTCTGEYGNYLKYNNPHKLSLYLSSGIPVFIWNEAAEAKFVTKNKVGFAISSLNDIPNIMNKISEKEYVKIVKNVSKISEKLVTGSFTKNALMEAESLINIEGGD